MERARQSRRKYEKLSDRLSDLEDDVIVHILSLLGTKLSVSTSILAKRWRYLWAQVPNLAFEGCDFKDDGSDQYLDTVHRVLMLHEARIMNTFSLSNVDCTEYQLETWITYAARRSVRNLYLDLYCMSDDDGKMDLKDLFAFPRCLLTCKTLVDLKLHYCKGIPSSGEILFPSLKKLDLSYVEYEDDKSLPLLLSGCLVLEELIINYEFMRGKNNLGCIDISAPTIKRLEVDLGFNGSEEDFPNYMVKINAPALRYLKLYDCSSRHVKSLTTLTYLIEADFCFFEEWHPDAEVFRNCLWNLKSLIISGTDDEKLIHITGIGSKVKLDNLTKLEIGFMIDFRDLVRFLEVADNLEVLILASGVRCYREPKRIPTCMLSCLRTIKFNRFNCYEHGFEAVRFLLRNAQILERMKIRHLFPTGKEKIDVLHKISLLERGSKSCQLDYY